MCCMAKTLTLFFPFLANCGAPPPGTDLNITISGPAASNETGSFVANIGATASYSCSNPMTLIPMGSNPVLTCMNDGGSASWSPAEAPVCGLGKYVINIVI